MNSELVDKNLFALIARDDWADLQLASQLVRGLGYQKQHLQPLLSKVTSLFVQNFLPDMDFHRFGCTLLDKMTFELIFNKLNEFLRIPFLQVEVCQDFLKMNIWVISENNGRPQMIEVWDENLTHSLFFSVKAKFEIGKHPIV